MQFLSDINRYPNREAKRKLYKGKGIIGLHWVGEVGKRRWERGREKWWDLANSENRVEKTIAFK